MNVINYVIMFICSTITTFSCLCKTRQ